MDADVVIIGSGAGGLTAAIVAAGAGLSVLVLESTPLIGGTTALSGGALWIPGNHHMEELGVTDSRAAAESYLRAVLGNLYDEQKVRAYLEYGPEMVRYMEQHSEVRLMPVPVSDYTPAAPGSAVGRCLIASPYDGTRLGDYLPKLRPPIPEMCVFQGMQVPHVDIMALRGWNRSLSNFVTTTKRVLRYAWDKQRHGKGAWLGNGNALTGRLLRSALDAGVTIWTGARASRLVIEHGRVVAVACGRNGGEEIVTAARGVVLASGGCGANQDMRRKYVPNADAGWSLQPEGCQGDGLTMGAAAGGHVVESNAGNGIWVPASSATRKDGSLAKFPSIVFDRHCPGSLMVDAATGRRFFNESDSYQNFGKVAIERGIGKAYIISDARAVRKYGLGMVKPAPFRVRPWVKKGYIVEAASIDALARKIGIDAKTLEDTVSTFNGYALLGTDPDFGRGADPYSVANGDHEHKPNPTMGPLTEAPFYALEIRPSDLSVVAGLETNANAQILDDDGQPIPGLYAAGLDNNSVFRGHYPGGGSSIGSAMTFAYIAARHLAA